jgi:hypothetical protein
MILKHIKIRWLSLYLSIERFVEVYVPVKKYFLDQHDTCPLEIKRFFELEEVTCVLSFLQHILFELHKKNLELQRSYTTAVDLYRIITSIKTRLQERLDSQFFGAACRYKLLRLPSDKQEVLKSSFAEFIHKVIDYIDSYFNKNVNFYRSISYFGQVNIQDLSWDQVIQCVEQIKIKDLDEDRLFDEFTALKSTLKIILDQSVSLFDQLKAFVEKQNSVLMANNDKHDENEERDESSTENKIVRTDQLWMLLFSLTEAPNFKKLVSFLYSLPCSNAYVESVFSQMKHLFNDKRNRMTVELISAELKIRLNATSSCIDMFQFVMSNQDLLKAIRSNEKYTFKTKNVEGL